MYEDHRVGVVIPAYNEAGFVGDVIDAVPSFVDRVYPIDDASTDGTWEEILSRAPDGGVTASDGGPALAASVGAPERRSAERTIVPIRNETNRGRGGCVKAGYRLAFAEGMDVVVVVDGDGQMDPGELHRFVDPIVAGEAEYAKGCRLGRREDRADMSRWRLFGNALLTGLTRIASGYWAMLDPQMGYTAASRAAIEAVDLGACYDDFGFLNDLLVRLNAADVAIVDVPVRAVYEDETSHISYSQFVPELSTLLLVRFLWRLRVKYVDRGFHPIAGFYTAGATAIVIGVLGIAWQLSGGPGAGSVDPFHAPLALATGLALTGGGMYFDRLENAHLRTRSPPPSSASSTSSPASTSSSPSSSSAARSAVRSSRSPPPDNGDADTAAPSGDRTEVSRP